MSKKKYQSSSCTVIDIQPKQLMMVSSTTKEVPYDPDTNTNEAFSREDDVTNYNVWEQ